MDNCKNCRFWDKDPSDTRGECLKTKIAFINYESLKHPKYDDSLMSVYATGEYTEAVERALETHADFGCVQFEVKVG